jgi:hypothetical protein
MDEIRKADVAHRQAYQRFVLLEAPIDVGKYELTREQALKAVEEMGRQLGGLGDAPRFSTSQVPF